MPKFGEVALENLEGALNVNFIIYITSIDQSFVFFWHFYD